MRTRLSIRPQLNISPQLVIAGQLLQVPGSELEQFINREVANNPALELVNQPEFNKGASLSDKATSRSALLSGDFSVTKSSSASSFDEFVENIARRPSPLEDLMEQVALLLNRADYDTAVALLHRLDDRGYLPVPTEQLAAELGVPDQTIKRVVKALHQLDPPGIGARDLRECFLIQCRHLEAEGIDCRQVQRVLTEAWDEFLKQQWNRVARKLHEPKKIVEDACEFMRLNLYPYPLSIGPASMDADGTLTYADLVVRREEHTGPASYSLEIPGEEEFELRVSTSFRKLTGFEADSAYALSPEEKAWIRTHVDHALMITLALRQRWETLRRIGEYLIKRQRDYFQHGRLYLKPLTRAAVAQELKMHESTMSRAVRDKVIQLPDGQRIPLSSFFDASLPAKEAIRILLRNSPQHLCDREIAMGLQAQGIRLARRTVTKYRREINIDSSWQQSIAM